MDVMDQKISLKKYLPFIEFLLKLDKKKYEKFETIQQWINDKKIYSAELYKKSEASIVKQYKILLLLNKKIPISILELFNASETFRYESVNLCSDEELENTCDQPLLCDEELFTRRARNKKTESDIILQGGKHNTTEIKVISVNSSDDENEAQPNTNTSDNGHKISIEIKPKKIDIDTATQSDLSDIEKIDKSATAEAIPNNVAAELLNPVSNNIQMERLLPQSHMVTNPAVNSSSTTPMYWNSIDVQPSNSIESLMNLSKLNLKDPRMRKKLPMIKDCSIKDEEKAIDKETAKEIQNRLADNQNSTAQEKLMTTLHPYINDIQGKLCQKEMFKSSTDTLESQQENVHRTNRISKGLECSVTGFSELEDYVTKNNGFKRRSSINVRAAIADQLNVENSENEEIGQSSSDEQSTLTERDVRPKKNRWSSHKARASVASQLNYSEEENIEEDPRFTERTNGVSMRNACKKKQRRATVSNKQDIKHRDAFSSDEGRYIIQNGKNDDSFMMVMLHRMSQEEIENHMHPETPTKPIHSSKPKKICKKKCATSQVKQKPGPKRKQIIITTHNTDEHMKEDNTKACPICASRAADMTNHIITRHNVESYVSRLSRQIAIELQMNTPFAVPLSSQPVGGNIIYQAKCAICSEEIRAAFNKFYDHYSDHTGEYVYQCSRCKLKKPFLDNIISHQTKAKNCHKARMNKLYLYPNDRMVIYLHCCTICNFMQLNEANIFKHLRDHHLNISNDPALVKKYVLVAIKDSDIDDSTVQRSAPSILDLPDDEGITVQNEPICDENLSTNNVFKKMEELFGPDSDNELPLQVANSNSRSVVSTSPITVVHAAVNSNGEILGTEQQKNILREPTVSPLMKKVSLVETLVVPTPMLVKMEIENEEVNLQETSIGETCSVENFENAPSTGHTANIDRNTPRMIYRSYPKGVSYFGLFKCMAVDCIYSTDVEEAFLEHILDHGNSECPPRELFECAYCLLDKEDCSNAAMLAAHIKQKHIGSRYQCPKCCYRTRVPGNVETHRRRVHSGDEGDDIVYDCKHPDANDDDLSAHVSRSWLENSHKLFCKECPFGCYALSTMEEHLASIHCRSMNAQDEFTVFACIYCLVDLKSIKDIREHLAVNHPEELAYMCARMLEVGTEEDALSNLVLNDVSKDVLPERIISAKCDVENNDLNDEVRDDALHKEDVKPTSEQLERSCLETLKPLLLKVTKNTGVSPDSLFHCPEPNCGGFFSLFDLWERHMKRRHEPFYAKCPHCPNECNLLELYKFQEHFKAHRRHLYMCFYCGKTAQSETRIHEHVALTHHTQLPEKNVLRLENISINGSYSYHVMLGTDVASTDRFQFLLELKEVLRRRKKQQEDIEALQNAAEWSVSVKENQWLESIPNKILQASSRKRCIVASCDFYNTKLSELLIHMRKSHKLGSAAYRCHICKSVQSVEQIEYPCKNWTSVFDHIKLHMAPILYVCCICGPRM